MAGSRSPWARYRRPRQPWATLGVIPRPASVARREREVVHKTPCGRTRRGDRLGPSPQLSIRANCLNLNQKKCKFLLCCRCCQAPWHIFFFPLCFSLHTVFFRKYFICSNVHQCAFEQCNSDSDWKRLQGQRRPRPFSWGEHPMRPITWPRSSWRLPLALRPIVSNDLLSVRALTPVTRCSLRLSTPVGRPRGGGPISTTACCAGPEFSRVASTSATAEV